MKWPKHILAQYVIQLCKAKAVKNIVISPGSRNAPFTIGFTNQPFFKCYSIVDERSAAFFALGIAQQTAESVAVICTSGSALLNYYPAVAEAFYTGIPLIVISADRPEHLINIGDGQTIIQPHAFGKHILFEANLETPTPKLFSSLQSSKVKAKNLILKAIDTAQQKMGPVHINVPFDEPLYDTVTNPELLNIQPFLKKPSQSLNLSHKTIRTWNNAQKKMVLVGVNAPNIINSEYIEQLAQDPSVIVLTETTSNLHHPNFFPFIDQLIAPLDKEDFANLQPELLLTFGGLIISKKIKAFLREFKPTYHWHVDEFRANDTYFALNQHFACNPNLFFDAIFRDSHPKSSSYFKTWNTVKLSRLDKHKSYISSMPFCDFKAFELISDAIPNHYMVQSSNSSAIRYLQLFEFHPSIKLYCNRGTSGIDGSTSTAVGAAVVSKLPTLLITGDLSFFYDINAFWNAYVPSNFRVILINNKGGGIFRILPGNDNSELFETFFETKHERTAKDIAKAYDFDYFESHSSENLKQALKTFFATGDRPKLLEIFTPSNLNDKVLLSYFDALK